MKSKKNKLLQILLLVLGTTSVVDGFDLHRRYGSVSRSSLRRTIDETTKDLRQRNNGSLSYLEKKRSELLTSSGRSIGHTNDGADADADAANIIPLSVHVGDASAVQVRPRRRQVIPIMVALIIGSFSVLEIVESLREEAEAVLGHAHGIVILSLIRLFRSIAILQTEAEEFGEAVEKMMEDNEEDGDDKDKKFSWQRSLTRFVLSRKVSIVACVMASIASIVEIVDDIKPGGHHGAIFLALSELNYQVNRFSHITDHSKKSKEVAANSKKKNRRFIFSSAIVGPTLFVAAACFAAFEIYEDMKPGAHHAVAVLALAELVENINRSKLMNRRRRRFFFFGPTVASHA